MNFIKKLSVVLVFIICLFFGLNQVKAAGSTLTIFHMNDTHGAILEGDKTSGLAKIASTIKSYRNTNENTLVISSGDMFQGTAISSMSRGEIMVDVMNEIGFDAMAIGNHEFDWGVGHIEKFHDGNFDNGEANFPFLNCNIIEKSTGKLVDWAQPYEVFELNGIKVGLIGSIDETCPNDIMASVVAPYTFDDQVKHIRTYAKTLRSQGCDLVIVTAHSGETGNLDESSLAGRLSKLTGDEKIDFCFNSHSHYKYDGYFTREDGSKMFYMQSGANGTYLGKVEFTLNGNNEITYVNCDNLYTISNCKQIDKETENVINKYDEQIDLTQSIIGKAKNTLYRQEGAVWCSKVLRAYTQADVAIVNYGGIRSNGFPIEGDVSYGRVFEVSPFENMVILTTLTGQQLNSISKGANTSNLYFSSDSFTFDASKKYRVATIDYLYEKTSYPFIKGENIEKLDVVFRDVLINEIRNSQQKYGQWDYETIYYENNIDIDEVGVIVEGVSSTEISILTQQNHTYDLVDLATNNKVTSITGDGQVKVFSNLLDNHEYEIVVTNKETNESASKKVVTLPKESDPSQIEVVAPTVKTVYETSVLLNTKKGLSYSVDKVRWYDSRGTMLTIEGLKANTTYTLYYKLTGASDDEAKTITFKTKGSGFDFSCNSLGAIYVSLSSIALVLVFRKKSN